MGTQLKKCVLCSVRQNFQICKNRCTRIGRNGMEWHGSRVRVGNCFEFYIGIASVCASDVYPVCTILTYETYEWNCTI